MINKRSIKGLSIITFILFNSIISFNNKLLLADIPKQSNNFLSTNSFNLKKISQFTTGQEVVDIFIWNNIAFLADQIKGLLIINISILSNLSLINKYQYQGESVYDIVVDNGMAFLAHGRAGLKILDVSNPKNIIDMGGYNDGGLSWKIFLENNFIYLVDRIQGIEIINVTKKSNPQLIGKYQCQPFDIFIRNNFAYIAAGINKGLEIVDISNPSNPKKTGEIRADFEDAVGVYVKDNYAYLALKENGLKIIDISKSAKPKLIKQYKDIDGGKTWAVKVKENFAYLADESGGLHILDVTNPFNAQKIGHYLEDESGKSFNVEAQNNLIFLANFNNGLEILTWKVAPPIPTKDVYTKIDSKILNFNHSVGPFKTTTFLGNETIGLNLSLYLDVGLLSPVNITVEAPKNVKSSDAINLKICISGENSYFWGRFEGTISFTTPLGSSELFSLENIGIPQYIQLAAFKTFIGQNITQNTNLNPIILWARNFLNYSLSFVMTPNFNITGSAIISGNINNSMNYLNALWSNEGEQLIIPIQIPSNATDFYGILLENLQFIINNLKLDFYNIKFDVLLNNLVSVYSWVLNLTIFNNDSLSRFENISLEKINQQATNKTLFLLDGIYLLGDYIIMIYFSSKIQLEPWMVLLILLLTSALILLPWLLIYVSRKNKIKRK